MIIKENINNTNGNTHKKIFFLFSMGLKTIYSPYLLTKKLIISRYIVRMDYGLIRSAGEDSNELSLNDSMQRFGSEFRSQQEPGVESFRHTLSVNAWQKVLHAATPVCSVNFSICSGVPGQTKTNFSFNAASSFRIWVLLSPV